MKYFTNKQVLKTCHIYQMLAKNGKKRHLSFHTPGHKIGKWDITELSFSDNLASPKGCILQAEQDLAQIVGAKRSFLLTDGSTAGVLSMLYAAATLGAKVVAMPQNSHQSAYHGCLLAGLTPLLFSADGAPTLDEMCAQGLEKADALLLTSPTYYGEVANLQEIGEYCRANGKLFLIDGAHGSHLHFDKKLYAGTYADMWVDGVHKNLPAFTQAALLSAGEGFEEVLGQAVKLFRTTSPSYPVMASIEYAVKYPRNERFENAVRKFADEQDRIRLAEDWTKVCALFGENAFAANEELEKRGLYGEFCDGNLIMFYLSPATTRRDFRLLKRELVRLFSKYPYIEQKNAQRNPAPLLSITNHEKRWVDLDKSEGKICALNCGMFPPCTPLILAGERIEREKIQLLQKAANVFGLTDGKIRIYSEE